MQHLFFLISGIILAKAQFGQNHQPPSIAFVPQTVESVKLIYDYPKGKPIVHVNSLVPNQASELYM